MARTPLLRALRQLAGEHAAAEAARNPRRGGASATREEQAYSRREFLKRTRRRRRARWPRPVRPERSRAAARAATAPRIAIVGGGIAGPDDGAHPAGQGSRLDGLRSPSVAHRRPHALRLRRLPGLLGQRPGSRAVRRADRHRATRRSSGSPGGSASRPSTCSAPSRTARRTRTASSATTTPRTRRTSDFKAIHEALHRDLSVASYPTTYKISTAEGIALDNMSIYEWIESRVPGGHSSPFGQLLDVAYNIEYGAETTDQSALNLVYLLGYSRRRQLLALRSVRRAVPHRRRQHPAPARDPRLDRAGPRRFGGAHGLAAELGEGERRRDGRARRSTRRTGQQTVTADHAVLCMSFSVLRTLDTAKAGFDPLKKTAITKLGSGANSKLQLQFASRLWNTAGPWGLSNGSTYADTGYQNTWDVTRGQPGATGILVDYTGGDVAAALRASVPYATAANAAGGSCPCSATTHRYDVCRARGLVYRPRCSWGERDLEG